MIPLLIDFDGVIRLGEKPANHVQEFFDFINDRNINSCIISNATKSSARDIKKFFNEYSINCRIPVMTAADATLEYVSSNYSKVSVYCLDHVKELFSDFLVDKNPEAVVMGDLAKNWNYEILNEIFVKVKNGAELVAMQTNRFWNTPEDGYLLDVGPFVKAIEYAANKDAVLIGKPSELYFQSALNLIGEDSNSKFFMIGDDLETDIGASMKLGGKACLIYTGKTTYPIPNDSKIKPNFEAMDLTEVIDLLKRELVK